MTVRRMTAVSTGAVWSHWFRQRTFCVLARIILIALALTTTSCSPETGITPGPGAFVDLEQERVHRANNLGVALLEQYDYESAAESFRAALLLDESHGPARLNLALALFLSQDLESAEQEARQAAQLMPAALEPPYLLGLIARAGNRPDDAFQAFSRVHDADPDDVGTNVNLGQLALETRDYPTAVERLRVAYDNEPYNVTAVYNLGLALVRSGDTDTGRERLEEAQTLRSSGYAVTYGNGYLAAGRYAEAIGATGAEANLVDPSRPATSFETVTIATDPARPAATTVPFGKRFSADELMPEGEHALAASLGGGLAAIDFDMDGDLDLFVATADGERLLRNDGPAPAEWTDVTDDAGLSDRASGSTGDTPVGVISADYNNDLAPDVFVLRHGTSSLYENDGAGRFTDVTADAGLPDFPYLPGAAAFADIDHDGDVDLVIAGLADLAASRVAAGSNGPLLFPDEFAPAPFLLLQNNQDGTFTDATEGSGLQHEGHVVALVPTDFDNRRDLDLLVVDSSGPLRLFMNLRDATFRDVAADVGLAAAGPGISSVATADINKDDFPDFVLADDETLTLAVSDGRGGFSLTPGPDIGPAAETSTTTQVVDYDNDGLLDLVTWTNAAVRLHRNLGFSLEQGTRWDDVTETAVADLAGIAPATARAVGVMDIDRDGDSDLVAVGVQGVTVATNSGAAGNGSLLVALQGLASNRSGVGAKVQLRAGSLTSRVETSASTPAVGPADVVFGLGGRPGADVARVLWPSGTLQAEVPTPPSTDDPAQESTSFLRSPLTVVELDREPSSCPFLYTWNGTEFEFVTDFLGGGEMGYWHGPDHYSHPDPVEYVRIRSDQLQPRDGMFELRVTNELEEAVFLDQVELVVLTHPLGVDVYPNEGMTVPPKPHQLHTVRDVRVPLRALDDNGQDVTTDIAALDRRYPQSFRLAPFRGHADTHTLTLDIGPWSEGAAHEGVVLLLSGWTAYSFSSDNVAALQAGRTPMPPALEIKGLDGRWRRATKDIGIPVGRPQTIALDLSNDLHPGEREVRILTSMRIYWDQILVGNGTSGDRLREARLPPITATLQERGFSAEIHPHHTEPTLYDYSRVTRRSPWKTMAGNYTREGDVLPLLTTTDDMFVIAKDGDEVALRFDASGLSEVPDGWTRTYLLKADGYSKEMDINSASPDRVEPLPFHAMRGYPYGASEHYPTTATHRDYRETYNTRIVGASVPPIDMLADATVPK